MTNTFEMREHGHARFLLHARNQALAATRDNDIDRAIEALEHLADRLAVCRRHELRRCRRKARSAKPLHEAGMDDLARMPAFRSAAQDARVAGLETQRGRAGGDAPPALLGQARDPDPPAPPPADGTRWAP